jgi:Glycosyl transferase family 2
MRIAIVTMVYNESINLPIWIRHYARHCPGAALFVVDHGSDDGSTSWLAGVSLIPLPRTPFDDQTRAEAIADLQHALLRYYDVVIYTDCDEMLVADPVKYSSLPELLAAVKSDVIAPTGLMLQQLMDFEPPIDLSRPVLGQRRYAFFGSSMCKPLIARVPLRWAPGFHWCNQAPDFRADLFQFHLKRMDIGVFMARLKLTRGMDWSERALAAFGRHQRTSDADGRKRFENPMKQFRACGPAPFAFTSELDRVVRGMTQADGIYRIEEFVGPIAAIPEAFFGLI